MDLATRKMVYYGLLGLLIAGSTITVFRVVPQVVPVQFLAKDGTFAIYFNNIPSDISGNQGMSSMGPSLVPIAASLPASAHVPRVVTVVSLNVTIDSIAFHESGANDSGWKTDVLAHPVTLDILQRTSVSVPIDSVAVPSENVTMVELHVFNATARISVGGILTPEQVVVSSGNLKLSIDSGARVEPQLTTSVVAVRPHIVVEGNGNVIRLTPMLSVSSVSGPD
jgi:hypothetical protein